MGGFLRHDFEKELKSRSQQHESQSQDLRPKDLPLPTVRDGAKCRALLLAERDESS